LIGRDRLLTRLRHRFVDSLRRVRMIVIVILVVIVRKIDRFPDRRPIETDVHRVILHEFGGENVRGRGGRET
jgi:hypothetical protein